MSQQPMLSQDNSPRILVVDNVTESRFMLKLGFRCAGYTVDEAESGRQAIELFQQAGLPDLVILDILLPELDGFAVAEAIQRLVAVPIIFLSTLSDTATKVKALSRYAEDYVTKPFAFAELLARIQRVLAHRGAVQKVASEVVLDGHLRINFVQQYVIVNQKQIWLTPLETRLLSLLYTYRGRILSPDFFLANAWQGQKTGAVQKLGVQIRNLRCKLEPAPDQPRYLLTIRGQGYFLSTPNQTDTLLFW